MKAKTATYNNHWYRKCLNNWEDSKISFCVTTAIVVGNVRRRRVRKVRLYETNPTNQNMLGVVFLKATIKRSFAQYVPSRSPSINHHRFFVEVARSIINCYFFDHHMSLKYTLWNTLQINKNWSKTDRRNIIIYNLITQTKKSLYNKSD